MSGVMSGLRLLSDVRLLDKGHGVQCYVWCYIIRRCTVSDVRLLDGGTGRATGSLGGSLSRRLGIHNPAQDQFLKLEIKNNTKITNNFTVSTFSSKFQVFLIFL